MSTPGIWYQNELKEKRTLLQSFWDERINKNEEKSIEGFKNFIIHSPLYVDHPKINAEIAQLFDNAVQKKITFEAFFNGLQRLPLSYLRKMGMAEGFIERKQPSRPSPALTTADLAQVGQLWLTKKYQQLLLLAM